MILKLMRDGKSRLASDAVRFTAAKEKQLLNKVQSHTDTFQTNALSEYIIRSNFSYEECHCVLIVL